MKNIYLNFFSVVIFLLTFFPAAFASVSIPVNYFSNGDFESGGLSGWNVVSGTAFSDYDITSQSSYWGGAFNHQGAFHLWGFNNGGDLDIGVMTSGRFVVGGDAMLTFKIGGGNNINNLYVALIDMNGNEINGFKATGNNSESYTDVTWNVSALYGQEVFLKVVDNATGNWGHLNLDSVDIPSSNYKRPENFFSNGSFETGNLSGWNILEGSAFDVGDVATESFYWGDQPFNKDGAHHLWGYKSGGDADLGVLTSGLFRLDGDGIIHFKISGGNDIEKLYVALMDEDNRELAGFKVTGNGDEEYRDVYWDASSHIGKTLYFKIVDASSGSFGHINIDGFEFTNSIYPTNTFINGNFEFGLLTGWNVLEGDAFTSDQVTSCESALYTAYCQYGDQVGKEGVYHFYGRYARYGHDNHASASGIMTSGIFVVGGDGLIELKIGGSNDLANCYITLVDMQGNEITGARRTGHGNSIYRYEIIDASSHIDEPLFFVVVDKKLSGSFINLDAIVLPQ
jgi:hypothetical protein